MRNSGLLSNHQMNMLYDGIRQLRQGAARSKVRKSSRVIQFEIIIKGSFLLCYVLILNTLAVLIFESSLISDWA